jgi:probable F420-dependent oxidoreductase
MQLGVTLGRLNPRSWADAARTADELGFESVWSSDHLVLPVRLAGSLGEQDAHEALKPTTPLFDPPAYLSYLAALTERVRLGTCVYLLGLRHPFITARSFATLDIVSNGRALCGVGAGWLTTEWEAAGVDPKERGARLDEAIGACRGLWREAAVTGQGRYFPFETVAFEPKPVQPAGVPILVGGESPRALRRAAELGDGWLGMSHTPDSAREARTTLERLRDAAGKADRPFTVTVIAEAPTAEEVAAFERAGVDRLITAPWSSSRTVVEDLRRYAQSLAPHLTGLG